MVMVARSIAALGAAVAAASTVMVQAAPLEYNPYTPVELNAPLTASHPAYGAKPKSDCVKPVVPVDPNAAHAQSMAVRGDAASRMLRDMEDASGTDVDDLASFFGEKLEVDFTTLQKHYAYATASSAPWPGSYWPTFQDGINHAWKHGEASASEKYARAFDLDAADLKNRISASNGIDSCNSNTACYSDTDCSSGVPCAKREGASSGYCIPTWYGICHAWAPAALLEDEPKCNVEKNGVMFHVMDIKALLTEVYDGADINTVFTGARFNGPDSPASEDQYGRFTDATRRDIGAGFFHIAITNIMGKHQTPFIIDVAADSEVWNQPVWSFHVQTMEIVDTAESCTKYFGTTSYPFNDKMVRLAYVKTTVMWAVEAYVDGPLVSTGKVNSYTVSNDYEYLLELDASNAIIGGEWVGDSKEDHPDFLWFATSKPDISTETSVGLKYANQRHYP
ncbi:elicitor-like transglutaminase [Phytophthora cinnamomi]|uniref:elicitor-like transglutaminase n=1 Tax=Phytophthora cinnamomi TaxID=4785 RepID=UPI003559D6A8|nr:elicitor-like transglutaminase [Phytophthora cinnamomi]